MDISSRPLRWAEKLENKTSKIDIKVGMCVIEINFFLGRIVSTHSRRRRLSDAYEAIHLLSDAYETSRRLSDAYGHIYNKKNYPCDFW